MCLCLLLTLFLWPQHWSYLRWKEQQEQDQCVENMKLLVENIMPQHYVTKTCDARGRTIWTCDRRPPVWNKNEYEPRCHLNMWHKTNSVKQKWWGTEWKNEVPQSHPSMRKKNIKKNETDPETELDGFDGLMHGHDTTRMEHVIWQKIRQVTRHETRLDDVKQWTLVKDGDERKVY